MGGLCFLLITGLPSVFTTPLNQLKIFAAIFFILLYLIILYIVFQKTQSAIDIETTRIIVDALTPKRIPQQEHLMMFLSVSDLILEDRSNGT